MHRAISEPEYRRRARRICLQPAEPRTRRNMGKVAQAAAEVNDRMSARKVGTWVLGLSALASTLIVSGVLLMLPAAWALRSRKATAPGSSITIDDAVSACRRSGLEGWPLVTFAQQMVYNKFRAYSCRSLWDTPAQAFRHGMGYCTQYNLALKQILDRLGIESEAVFSLRVRVADRPEWTMGHTWLRVNIDGDVRTVCAGRAGNLPGSVNFTPLVPVRRGRTPLLLLSHLGMILFCGYLEWRAFLTGDPLPAWMFMLRSETSG
jgi:hypothetical protein